MIRALLSILLLLGIAACDSGQQARQAEGHQAVTPALWEVRGPDGERGYLFATIHQLWEPVKWRTAAVDEALRASKLMVVEASEITERGAVAAIFTELAHSGPEPALSLRVPPERRDALLGKLATAGLTEEQFAATETWAVALTLAQAMSDTGSSENGIDRALLAQTDLPVRDLEGARTQLLIFDTLPEREQRDMLALVVAHEDEEMDDRRLATAWARGDMDAIAAESRTGLLADPELRDALLVRRNAAWVRKVEEMMRAGKRPFVAVGAAHLAGEDGLPALLAARGWTVRRVQ
ncbi:TraB/GumN family protein [Pseudoblastomonas halimionae]|uniref:TraB/GumN family protein n=1 Tax=Alteriqipengyuania halimionae TaxID=1926630 RepID=A0A6I4U3S6_9SPHN|nr:TraB/GumN family protein [Alteriqipengyuania halimionae]MXP09573.1 TraB/GumN family protein [Alteriqipengyuania halimionae]